MKKIIKKAQVGGKYIHTIGDTTAFKKTARKADSTFNVNAKEAGFVTKSFKDQLRESDSLLNERIKAKKTASPPKIMKCGGRVKKGKKGK